MVIHNALFILPKGSNVITIIPVGFVCPFNSFIKDIIIEYFKNNRNLFEEHSNKLTTAGEELSSSIKERGGLSTLAFEFKIHRGDGEKKMNDFYLNFEDKNEPCGDENICNITCVTYPRKHEICDRYNKIGTQSQKEGSHTPLTDKEYREQAVVHNYPINSNSFLLSQLINISPEGGTYVIITCRETGPENELRVAREISASWLTLL
jgi:hypothetical protein